MNKPLKIFGINVKGFLILVVITGAFFLLWPSAKRYPPGILISTSPQIDMIEKGESWTYQSADKQYTITAKAKYALKARVLSVNKEYSDSRIGPLDIVVGWGAMSDQKVLDQMKIWQDNTRYWYCKPRGGKWPIELSEIALHAVNTHIIPANSPIEKKLKSLRRGDLINLRGDLVDVSGDNNFSWRTSVGPSGFGDHSCKIIWVESLENIKPE